MDFFGFVLINNLNSKSWGGGFIFRFLPLCLVISDFGITSMTISF